MEISKGNIDMQSYYCFFFCSTKQVHFTDDSWLLVKLKLHKSLITLNNRGKKLKY